MSINKQKIQNTDIHIRCVKCSKLLGKNLSSSHLEIKCLRCGVLNLIPKLINDTDQVVIKDSLGNVLHINKIKKRKKKRSNKYEEV